MLHCRNSYDDVLDILENYKKEFGARIRGNAHFFAGSVEQARKFLDIGFTMSFTGIVTFTKDYDEVIRFLPKESIMSETDSPFVAPIPYRGKRNEPSYVAEVVKKLAEIRGESVESITTSILRNTKRVFGIGNA
jgi:TatD DNase family protein